MAKRGRPAFLTPEERKRRHQERERNRYRKAHGIPLDAPVSGSPAAPTGSAPVTGTFPGPRGQEAKIDLGSNPTRENIQGSAPAVEPEDWELAAGQEPPEEEF